MPFKTDAELEKIRREIYDVIWPMLSDFNNEKWTLKDGSDVETTGKVYKGDHPKLGVVWKLQVNIDMSADEYYERVVLGGDIVGWVPKVEEYRFLEHGTFDKYDWTVTYSKAPKIGTVASRDFVNFNIHQKLNDGSRLTLNTATSHPDEPKKTGCVRGIYLPSGSLLRPIPGSPNRCELHWINNSDMKGFLPRALINMIMSSYLLEFSEAVIKKAKGEL